jgi:PKD repeat protein
MLCFILTNQPDRAEEFFFKLNIKNMKKSSTFFTFLSIFLFSLLILAITTEKISLPFNQKNEKLENALKELSEKQNENQEGEEHGPSYDKPNDALLHELKYTRDPKTKHVPVERLIPAFEYAKELEARDAAPLSITWKERGPNNVAGRTRAILVDLNDVTRNTVFTGGVGGGLWKTTNMNDVNPTWTNVNNFFDNIAITTITQNPANPQEIYFGTGEGWFNVDAIRGLGIWKSTDGGTTFNHLTATNDITRFACIQNLKVHPTTGHIYAATRGRSGFEKGPGLTSDLFGGIYRSTDGGTSWTMVLGPGAGAVAFRAADVEIAADGTLYAAMGVFQEDGIYKSATGDLGTWTKLNVPLSGFPATGFFRLEIATAPSAANTFYVVAQNSVNYGILGIYKSTNAGTLFTACALPTDADPLIGADYTRSQAWYDLICAVDPNNANVLYVGGIDLFKSITGGASWTQISHWTGSFGSQYVHADQHAIVFQPGSSDVIYFGNDGGIFKTSNGTALVPTIKDKNLGYNVTQYYACSIHPTANTNHFLAGAQDNGSQKYSSAGMNSTVEVTGGDGAFTHIDQNQPQYQFTSYVFNNYFRSTDGGNSFTSADFNDNGQFINPTDYDNTANIMYCANTAGNYLRWDNPQAGATSSTVTTTGFDTLITAVTVSPNVANRVYFGFEDAEVKYVDAANTGTSKTATDISTGLPADGFVSCIAIEPGNENHIIVTYSNYGVNSVWESINGGTSWTSIEGNLPDMPVWWAMFSPLNNDNLLLATEIGVWTTDNIDGGSTVWGPSNTGMANVSTRMLKYRTSDNFVIAATHGRGLYSTDAFSSARVAFGANKTVTYIQVPVTFTDDSYQATTWLWNFGDGNTSTSQNPSHSYNASGTYNVSLTINGSLTETKNSYITVLPQKGIPFMIGGGASYTGDFETSPTEFANETASGTPWERGNSSVLNKNGTHSGSFAWVTGLTAPTYFDNSISLLYTPEYNFTNAGTYTISFWAKYQTEATWDGFRVESTTDNGNSWTPVGTLGLTWYNFVNPVLATVFPAGEPFFSGTQATYTQYSTDISSLAGNSRVAFRFHFRTDGNTPDVGVAIDDFEINGPANPPLPVELASFSAITNKQHVNLSWSTASEINNKGFNIERKLKVKTEWSTAGFIEGKGTTNEITNYNFTDRNLISGTYNYRLQQIDYNGNYEYHNLSSDVIVGIPTNFALSQNYPNPFNPTTKINFELPIDSRVSIKIYDVTGREVFALVNNETRNAGYHTVTMNANNFASGVYFYIIKAESINNTTSFSKAMKMMLIK